MQWVWILFKSTEDAKTEIKGEYFIMLHPPYCLQQTQKSNFNHTKFILWIGGRQLNYNSLVRLQNAILCPRSSQCLPSGIQSFMLFNSASKNGFECKINRQQFRVGRGGKLKQMVFPSQQQLLQAATCSLYKEEQPLLLYWLSLKVKRL